MTIDAGVAATRQTAVLLAAMRHGNKTRPSGIGPSHRRIRDFSCSFRAVYGPDVNDRARRWRSTVRDDWPQPRQRFADIAIHAVPHAD